MTMGYLSSRRRRFRSRLANSSHSVRISRASALVSRFVGGVDKGDAGADQFLRALPWRQDRRPRILQPSCMRACDQENRGRFADVVGAALEGEPEHAELLAAQGPQRAADFAQEALPLLFVDTHDFVEQDGSRSRTRGPPRETPSLLGEAGAAVADAGIQEARADAACPCRCRAPPASTSAPTDSADGWRPH